MRKYVVNNKEFTTICSVHNEILRIVSELSEENISDSTEKIKNLVKVAKEMGQNMEDVIKNRNDNIFGINMDFHNYYKNEIRGEEEE